MRTNGLHNSVRRQRRRERLAQRDRPWSLLAAPQNVSDPALFNLARHLEACGSVAKPKRERRLGDRLSPTDAARLQGERAVETVTRIKADTANSVFRWRRDIVDDQDLRHAAARLKPEAKLLLNCGKHVGDLVSISRDSQSARNALAW